MLTMLVRGAEWLAGRALTMAVALRSWRGEPDDFHVIQHLAAARMVANPGHCDDGCRAEIMVDLLRPYHAETEAPSTPATPVRSN